MLVSDVETVSRACKGLDYLELVLLEDLQEVPHYIDHQLTLKV